MATVRHLGLFPFCLPFANPVFGKPDYRNANGVNASMMFYWRVKEFAVTFTMPEVTFTQGGQTITLEEEEVTTKFTRPERNEKYLVCGFGTQGTNGAPYLIEDTYDEENVRFTGLQAVWLDKSDITNPQLRWAVNISYVEIGRRVGWRFLSVEKTLPGFYYTKAQLLMAQGNVFEFHCELFDDGTSDGGLYLPTLQVTEYWEYDPLDGLGPIYDKITGKQLRPFPS
jgi:hypothetical protein